jgi:hypothetical protein
MRLYLLRPIHNEKDDPWEPWYDKAFGFVVRAENEEQARTMANDDSGDENGWKKEMNVWLSPVYSTCNELTADGNLGIIIKDFHSA